MCQHAVSRRGFFQRMALGSVAGASILDLASRRAAWAQAMVPGAATGLFNIQYLAENGGETRRALDEIAATGTTPHRHVADSYFPSRVHSDFTGRMNRSPIRAANADKTHIRPMRTLTTVCFPCRSKAISTSSAVPLGRVDIKAPILAHVRLNIGAREDPDLWTLLGRGQSAGGGQVTHCPTSDT
jgi:hypothetical protein